MRSRAAITAVLLAVMGAAGCGDDDERADGQAAERADRPADPPPGWGTVVDRRAGFTVSLPRGWQARPAARGMLLRSRDRLVAVSIQADRSELARVTPPDRYARDTIASLPGYRDLAAQNTRGVRGSPYESARIDGVGIRAAGGVLQRVTVAAFHRPRAVTYAALAFRDARRTGRAAARTIDRVLASFRAQPARSGRSG